MIRGFAYLRLASGETVIVPSDTIVSVSKQGNSTVVEAGREVYECVSIRGDVLPRGEGARIPPSNRRFDILVDGIGRKSVLVDGDPDAPLLPGEVKRRVDESGGSPEKREDFLFALPVILVERGSPVRFYERPRPCDCEYPTTLAVNRDGLLTFITEKEEAEGEWCALAPREWVGVGDDVDERAIDVLVWEGIARRRTARDNDPGFGAGDIGAESR